MEKSAFTLPIECHTLQQSLPHRFPFFLIDRVLSLEPSASIEAIKNISLSDPILQGHFPGRPVYPGVLIIESMAQASAILGYYSSVGPQQQILLTEITQARFRRMVIPGDTLHIKVQVSKMRAPFFWFQAEASVAGELAATASVSARMT